MMQSRIIITLTVSLFYALTTIGQEGNGYFNRATPYKVDLKKDIPLALGAYGFYWYGVHTLKNEDTPVFTTGQLDRTDVSNINFIDRGSVGNWDPDAKDIGKFFLRGSNLVPLGMVALPGNLNSRASLLLMYYEGFYLTGGLVTMTKGLTDRYRPFTYLSSEEVENLTPEFRTEFLDDISCDDIEDSFFSGDAARTGYSLMFMAKTISDYFPESKYRKWVYTASILSVGAQGYFRVKSGKHFPTDVIVGSVVGTVMGYLIPHFHKRTEDRKVNLNVSTGGLSLVVKI